MMARINRRRFLLSASASVAAPSILMAADADTVRFGVLHPNLTTVIHEIAKRTGAYERNNLKGVETRFKSGQTVEGVEQLWRGKLDFYTGGAPELNNLKVGKTRFKSGQTVEGVEQLWRGNLDFYMGGAPAVPRLSSRMI